MSSNILSTDYWKIKIHPIPSSITVVQLAQIINLSSSRIHFSKTKEYNIYYALIDNFPSKEEANIFAQQWDGSLIFDETVKCIVVAPESYFEIISNTQQQSHYNKDKSNLSDNEKNSMKSSSNHFKEDLNQPAKISDLSTIRSIIRNEEIEDRRSLSQNTNKEIYRERSTEYKYRHQPFNNDKIDSDSEDDERGQYRRDSYSSTSSTQSMQIRLRPCLNGMKCFKANCPFDHPNGWNPCRNGVQCRNYDCKANHPYKRKKKCDDGELCKISNCEFLHPDRNIEQCSLRAKCKKWDCELMHPRSRTWVCRGGENCSNLDCELLHPPSRIERLSPNEINSDNLSLEFSDPSEQPIICDQVDVTSHLDLTHFHRSDWNAFNQSDQGQDEQNSEIDQPDRIINIQKITTTTTTKTIKLSLILYYFCSIIENNYYYFYYLISFIPIGFIFLIFILLETLLSLANCNE